MTGGPLGVAQGTGLVDYPERQGFHEQGPRHVPFGPGGELGRDQGGRNRRTPDDPLASGREEQRVAAGGGKAGQLLGDLGGLGNPPLSSQRRAEDRSSRGRHRPVVVVGESDGRPRPPLTRAW